MAAFPLRIGRSRSIWEDGTLEEILRLEFPSRDGGVDLRPSVYLVETHEVDRARSEHLVGRLGPPLPLAGVDLDLNGFVPPTPSRGTGDFEFTNSRHAELLLENADQLRDVARAVQAQEPRRLGRSLDSVMSYVASRLAVDDPEWVQRMADAPKWKKVLSKWLASRPQVH